MRPAIPSIRRIGVSAGLLAIAGIALLSAAPAQAARVHQLINSFALPSSPPTAPLELAINQSTGEVYATNEFSGAAYALEESGAPDPAHPQLTETDGTTPFHFAVSYGIAVDNSGGADEGHIYVVDYGVDKVFQFGPTGVRTAQTAITGVVPAPGTAQSGGLPPVVNNGRFTPTGVAVGPDGNVYVSDQSNGVVDVFKPGGEFVEQLGAGVLEPKYSLIYSVEVDSHGNVYVSGLTNGVVELDSSGHCVNSCAPFGHGSLGVAVDAEGNVFNEEDESGYISEYAPSGELIESFGGCSRDVAVNDNTHDVYAACGEVDVFGLVTVPNLTVGEVISPTSSSGTLTGTVSAAESGEEVTTCQFEYGTYTGYGTSLPCLDEANAEVGTASKPIVSTTPVRVHADLSSLTAETTYHYRLTVGSASGEHHGGDHEYTPHFVFGLETEPPNNLTAISATLNGSFVGNGEETHFYFEWGEQGSFENDTPLTDAFSPNGPDRKSISAGLSELRPNTRYQYRVVAVNGAGTSVGRIEKFATPKSKPIIAREFVTNVHADSAVLHVRINPGGTDTTYHFEYGPAKCSASPGCTAAPVPYAKTEAGVEYLNFDIEVTGLSPSTTYYFRVVASNETGTAEGPDRSFSTFGLIKVLEDKCQNAHVRQQTAAALLLDCRAYELVSSADAGGYAVESTLVPGQSPFSVFPAATDPARVLYAVHDGGIPGANHPTNRGSDPYVATRGANGWSTEYVGVPANDPFAAAPFSSRPTGADAGLSTFAFGGPEGCSPCFEGGYTGIPVRLPDGRLVQGMVAAADVSPAPGPDARPDGKIAKDLSANGEHLIFGSTAKFAEGGNDENGDVSIYDRNLGTSETHVVSNAPAGGPLVCLQGAGKCDSAEGDANGIAELDVSADGSRVLVGQKVSEDAEGHPYYHLYMDVGDASRSIDLTPNTTTGVLYDGMTEDGSKVFFTTSDRLLPAEDTDQSADLYMSEVSGQSATLHLISTGIDGAGNTDECDPVASSTHEHWNTIDTKENCGVIAVGGGVASGDGTVYFLSPEKLDGSNGVENLPNLYVSEPGAAPRFVATLDRNDALVSSSLENPGAPDLADFQVTSDGRFAAFTTTVPLEEEFDNAGFSEVYRYATATAKLNCVSCNPTHAVVTGSSSLPASGISLATDGRVFFNSLDALAPSDLDEKQDAYEWEEAGMNTCEHAAGCVGLISTGTSPFPSSLLGISSDGTNAYFFTRDTLVPEDDNGQLVKIYDAREGGGFLFTPPPPPCKASDECHGPSSPTPTPPAFKSLSKSGVGGFQRKKKAIHHHHHHHHHDQRPHSHGRRRRRYHG